MKKVNIFGVKVDNITFKETIEFIDGILKNGKKDKLSIIYTPNTEIIMAAKEDKNIKATLNNADLILPDGIGLIYGSRIRKVPLKERVTGFDTSMEILKLANKYSSGLYLLGGAEGISEKAAETIKESYPGIRICGHHNGFFKGSHTGDMNSEEEKIIIDEINSWETDIIFVGLGFPKQEIWIDQNKDKIDAKIIIGNGGVMDVLAGKAKRAPEIYQKLGLEWLYRLIKDPKRIKRQMALPKFMINVILDKESVKEE